MDGDKAENSPDSVSLNLFGHCLIVQPFQAVLLAWLVWQRSMRATNSVQEQAPRRPALRDAGNTVWEAVQWLGLWKRKHGKSESYESKLCLIPVTGS